MAHSPSPFQSSLHQKPVIVHRKSYIRIDPKLIRVCASCKRKNARVQLIRMIKTNDGHVRLDKGSVKVGKPTTVCDRKSCIAKALERKKFDYWVKIPLGQDVKKTVSSH